MLKTRGLAFFAVVSILCAKPAFGADSSTRGADETPTDASAAPSLGFTVLGGLSMPSCNGQTESCTPSFGPAPSIRALVLYQPTANWGLGLAGQVAWVHWRATYVGFFSGDPNPSTQTVESDLTAGFGGIAARYTPVPDWRVTPVMELALGASFQAQTGSNFGCNGPAPAGEIGLGARARLASSLSVFVMASATGDFRGSCGVSDGPPATPFAGGGYGVHAGAAFDVGLGSRSPGPGVAQR